MNGLEEFIWAAGLMLTIASLFLGIWWKVESRQDHKIDQSIKSNAEEHKELRELQNRNHQSVIDRIENIWQHLVHGKDKNE